MNDTFGGVLGRLVCGAIPVAVALSSASAAAATSDPTAPAAPTHLGAEKPPVSESPDDEGGLLGPVRLGVLAGVSFPRPVSVEGMLKVRDVVSVGLEYSALPPIDVSGVHAGLYAVAVDLSVFPMRNGFFLGVNAGKQHFSASGSATLPMGMGTVAGAISADTWFLGARVGFLRTWKSGFSLGMDAGAQIPVAATFTSSIPAQVTMSQAATDVAHVVGKNVLPNINLVRIGYLF